MSFRLFILSFFMFALMPAYADLLSKGQLGFEVKTSKSEYHVTEPIDFQLVLTASTNGDVASWETTDVELFVYRVDSLVTKTRRPTSSVVQAYLTTYFNSVTTNCDDCSPIYPAPVFVGLIPGEPYVLNGEVNNDVGATEWLKKKVLSTGFYEIRAEYRFRELVPYELQPEDDEWNYVSASVYVHVTTGDVNAVLEYWLSMISDPDLDSLYVDSALGNIRSFTGQQFFKRPFFLEDMVLRNKTSDEYRQWWERSKDKYSVFVQPGNGKERLKNLNDKRCRSCYRGPSFFNYGEIYRETPESVVVLGGETEIMYAGLYSITIKNNSLPNDLVVVQRASYTQWQGEVSLVLGENIITVEAEDYLGNINTLTFTIMKQ